MENTDNKLTEEPSRNLTDRECTKMIGAFIGGLSSMTDAQSIIKALQWWAHRPDVIVVIKSMADNFTKG